MVNKKRILQAFILFSSMQSPHSIAQIRPFGAWSFSAPTVSGTGSLSPNPGDIIYNSTLSSFYGWNGSTWLNFSTAIINYSVQNVKTANYNILTTDNVVPVNSSGGGFTVTLYDATTNPGGTIIIKKQGTDLNSVTLNTSGSQTIDGVSSGNYALYTPGESLTIVSDGSNWQILDHKTSTGWVNAGANTITATTTNPTKATSPTVDNVFWRREGSNAQIRIEYKQVSNTGATAGSGDYLFQTPVTIDTTQITAYATVIGWLAQINSPNSVGSYFSSGGTSNSTGGVFVYDSMHVRFGEVASTTGSVVATGMLSSGGARNLGASGTTTYAAIFTVPVLGWQP